MNSKISPILPTLYRFPVFALAGIALLLNLIWVPAEGLAGEKPSLSPVEVARGAAARPAEDREALLARLTKVLAYGSELGVAKPSKTDVVVALGVIGDERSVPVLAEHLANNESKFLRLRIVRALGWIGGQQVIPPLEMALKDEYPPVRKQAADVLQKLTGRSYEYDQTGLPQSNDLSALEVPTPSDTRRLERIADEVKKRREIRQAQAAGSNTPLKKKITEPVDIEMVGHPVGWVVKTYSGLTGKLVLMSPRIASAAVTCKIEKAAQADAKAALEKALLVAGVQVVDLEPGVVAFVPTDTAKPADKP